MLPEKRYNEHVLDWYAERRQPLWEENLAAAKRLADCFEWLAQCCRDGELQTFARLTKGGDLYPVNAEEWNVDSPLAEFVIEGGPLRRFSELGYRGGPFASYLFFDKEELSAFLAKRLDAKTTVSETDLSRLSPYLRLAVRVALERSYFDRSSCETKDVREAEIRRAWPDLMPEIAPVESTVRQLAKLMAFPDPMAIEQGKAGAQSRKTGKTPKT